MNVQALSKDSLHLAQRIKQGEVPAFEEAFKNYYPPLASFACGILKDDSLAEEQVQDVFALLWERRLSLPENLGLFSYLLIAVRNKCINIINHGTVQRKYISQTQREYQTQILNDDYHELSEHLIEKLYTALNQLPEKCKEVFKLSRFDGLSHKEIAFKLNISTKTVENQITKAFKVLRNEMYRNALSLLSCIVWLL